MTFKELLRMSLLADFYNNLSESDKQLFLQSDDRIRESLNRQEQSLSRIENKVSSQGFSKDLLANISGNVITDAVFWIGKNLISKL